LPWEYDNGDLVTLCGKCHKELHEEVARKEADWENYMDCVYRGKRIDGLFLYYKQIGDLHDVITTIRVNADDYPAMYDVDMYWRNVMPYSEFWNFSACAGVGNGPICGTKACWEVRDHVWHNDPDEILTKEQFENVRKGFNIDKECISKDEWNMLNAYYFDYAAEKYSNS
jgi:hypothetical protein